MVIISKVDKVGGYQVLNVQHVLDIEFYALNAISQKLCSKYKIIITHI